MKKVKILLFVFFCFFIFSFKTYALDEGIYIFHSAINKDYVLDISGGVAKNYNNVQLYLSNGTYAQKFKITKTIDGFYEITSLINSNFSLDVNSASFSNFANIQLYEHNNTIAQKWIIKDVGDGYYTICSYNDDYVLDVDSAIAENYRNIQLYRNNGTNAQKFKLERVFENKQTIENGLYIISSKLNDKVLDVKYSLIDNNVNIQLYRNNGTDAQKWFVNYLGNGYYSIKPYLSLDYSIDVLGAGIYNGTNVQLYKYNNSNAQKWVISDAGDGYYNIVSLCNKLVLDVANANTNDEANIWTYEYNGTNAQKFKFDNVIEKGEKTISDGYYFINTSLNKNKVLDIENANISNNTNVQIYDINYSLAQKWYIKYLDNGYYLIMSDKDNNYVLEKDILGTNVKINMYNENNSNQKWIIKKTGNNFYIISDDGRYLDLASAQTENKTNIAVYTPNGTNAQKFNFIKTASGLSERVIQNGIYRIASALDNSMVIDLDCASTLNGSNIQLYKTNGTNAQKWQITYLDNGYYKITNLINLTKSFDVASGNTNNEANVQIYDNNNSLAQQWIIKDAGDGYFYIISNCGGLYIDVANSNTANGTNILLWEYNGGKNQKFKFIKSEKETRVVDVSYHQGSIDWNKVYNSGIYGVILRIGYWNTQDERFEEYINEVKRLGIPYGIYLFSYANTTNGASIEANFTNNMMSKYNLNPTLGIYYDLEDWYIGDNNNSHMLSKEEYDNLAITYINTVSSYVGNKYKVKIYADLNHVNNRFGNYARSQSDWIAHYDAPKCGYTGSYSLWQYTSSATLDGIPGYVDMSYLY